MIRGKAMRRHHDKRVLEKRRGYNTVGGHSVGKMGKTPKPCSCVMCGNPRKHFNEPTMQERRLAPIF